MFFYVNSTGTMANGVSVDEDRSAKYLVTLELERGVTLYCFVCKAKEMYMLTFVSFTAILINMDS